MNKLHPKSVYMFFLTDMYGLGVIAIWIDAFISFFFFISSNDESETVLEIEMSSLLFEIFVVVAITALIFVFIIAPINFIRSKLKHKFYLYEFKVDTLQIESGIIAKHYISIPYKKMQNIDITRSFIERVLGLSSVHVQTAGTSTSEGIIPGLSVEKAEEIREDLTNRIEKSQDH